LALLLPNFRRHVMARPHKVFVCLSARNPCRRTRRTRKQGPLRDEPYRLALLSIWRCIVSFFRDRGVFDDPLQRRNKAGRDGLSEGIYSLLQEVSCHLDPVGRYAARVKRLPPRIGVVFLLVATMILIRLWMRGGRIRSGYAMAPSTVVGVDRRF